MHFMEMITTLQYNSLLSFQYPQFRTAEMATDLVASRLMIRNAAHAIDNQTPGYPSLCAMAKLFATEKCSKVRIMETILPELA